MFKNEKFKVIHPPKDEWTEWNVGQKKAILSLFLEATHLTSAF